jgi:plastocyanin
VKVALAAQNTAFDKTQLQFPAGTKVEILFDNKDAGIPHNVAFFSDETATQVIFRGEVITGPATTTYTFDAPPSPGSLYFHCDVHPTTMKGTAVVGPPGGGGGEGGGGGGGGGGPGATVVAQGTAFHPTDVTVHGGGQVTIHFDNKDAGLPHNMAVFQGADATAPVVFRGDIVTGPATKDYTFAAPPPGSYFFHCDVHPTQMMGTLKVT